MLSWRLEQECDWDYPRRGRKVRYRTILEAASGGAPPGIKPKHVAILKQAGVSIDPSMRTSENEIQRIRERLHQGVFLENGTWKFSVDKANQKDRYFLYARALRITSGDDTSYWRWLADEADKECEAAELLRVMWLEVRGKFNTANLERKTRYQISFMVKLRRGSNMEHLPLTVRLTLPDRTRCENQRSVGKVDEWVPLVAGEFSTSVGSTDGEMEICLEELGASWKSGLVIKGIELKPL